MNYIDTIKQVREMSGKRLVVSEDGLSVSLVQSNWGLKESKDFVDSIMREGVRRFLELQMAELNKR